MLSPVAIGGGEPSVGVVGWLEGDEVGTEAAAEVLGAVGVGAEGEGGEETTDDTADVADETDVEFDLVVITTLVEVTKVVVLVIRSPSSSVAKVVAVAKYIEIFVVIVWKVDPVSATCLFPTS